MLSRLSPEELASIYDESREKMLPAERLDWLNQRLVSQLRFAYENAPAVKEKFDNAGITLADIQSIEDLERLPVTKKDDLIKLQHARPPFGGFLAKPVNSLNRVYLSPGPIYDAFGMERVKSAVRGFLRAGYPRQGDVVLVSMAYNMVPAGLMLTDALDLIGCTVVPAGTGQTELQVKLLHDLQATAIFGFPSFVMNILQKAEEMGYDVRNDFNLKYVQGAGERHIDLLRKRFMEDYGLKLIGGYGTADLGEVAYSCSTGEGYHFADEDCIVEIVDPETGRQMGPMKEGEVVVTLFSDVYPLVRFGTGDLATYTDEVCQCGRTVPRISRILGMIGDHIRVKGMFVHLRELDKAMSRLSDVSRYQMVAYLEGHRDGIALKIEEKPDSNKESLSRVITETCRDVFRLKVDQIEFVDQGTLVEPYSKFLDTRWEQ